MPGVFKSLDRSDVRLTPFRAHKLATIEGSTLSSSVYEADYNPISSFNSNNPLNVSFDIGNSFFTQNEPTTSNGQYQRIVHRSLDHLYYRDYYTNPKATFGGGNINLQHRFLEDKAKAISVGQQIFGESILPGSVRIYVDYAPGSQNLVLVDDLNGNLVISSSYQPLGTGTQVSSSVSSSVGEWPSDQVYKYIGKGLVSFVGKQHKGDWVMEAHHNNLISRKVGSDSAPFSENDMVGASFAFSAASSSYIEVGASLEQSYLQRYNFDQSDFSISALVQIDSVASQKAMIIEKQGPSRRVQIDLNGNPYTEPVLNRCPYRLFLSSSGRFVFERQSTSETVKIESSVFSPSSTAMIHIAVVKSGSIFEMFVNGSSQGTANDVPDPENSSNFSNIYIGNSYELNKGFNGCIDGVRLYNRALTDGDVQLLYRTQNVGNLYVGNVFYSNGLITLTSIPSRFMTLNKVELRGTQTIYETEISCTVNPGEFGMSMNRSLQRYDSNTNQFLYTPFVSSSEFRPFVTTIGLYNDQYELVAIAKLSTPIQLPTNVDTTFIVKFDKW